MKRAAVAAVAAATLLAAAPAAGQHHGDHGPAGTQVAIEFAAFAPEATDVLAGDAVTWSNVSARRHDVAALDGSWESGSLSAGGRYTRMFDAPGPVAYYCTIHPSMRGVIGVHELLLTAPTEPGAPGRPLALHGRTSLPAGTAIDLEADEGAGFVPVARTQAGQDGGFAATLHAHASARLRAVAGAVSSPPVQLLVLDRSVTAAARSRHDGHVQVRTQVLPASPGATVVLQLRLRERFGWWPVRRAKLDGSSRARFHLRVRRPVRARVVLTLADGATPLAVSRTLRLGPGHRAPHHH